MEKHNSNRNNIINAVNNEMNYIKEYLLPLEKLDKDLLKRGMQILDGERLKRLKVLRVPEKQMEALGAGLLLQKAVRDWQQGSSEQKELSLLQLITELEAYGDPLPLQYHHGENGKPYFKELALFFSLSHSDGYVLCVVSGQEIGADIQKKKLPVKQTVINRCFAEREREYWHTMCQEYGLTQEEASVHTECADWFYRLWCRKEAWGKLTGKGMTAVLGQDCEAQREICWQESETAGGQYQIAICTYCTSF